MKRTRIALGMSLSLALLLAWTGCQSWPRETLDYAIVGVAASVRLNPTDLTCRAAAVVLTGVASAPKIVEEAASLRGVRLTDEAIAPVAAAATKLAYPVKNVVGSEPGYRRAMVTLHVARALNDALAIAAAAPGEET